MSDIKRLWLIGGTSESVQLAVAIAQSKLPCIISVTTPTAKAIYPVAPSLEVWVGQLDANSIEAFLQVWGIVAILDASHPFALVISQLAIFSADKYNIPYLRYERRELSYENENLRLDNYDLSNSGREKVIEFDSVASIVNGNYLQGERVLLTLGYRFLDKFRVWQEKAVLFARILPSLIALDAAVNAGFTPDRIMAIRPPISADLERALWRNWQISVVITKASGIAGGEDIKRLVAKELGVILLVIKRPEIVYPELTTDFAVAWLFCEKVMGIS